MAELVAAAGEPGVADFLALPQVDAQLGQALATLRLGMRRALDARRQGGHEYRGKGRSQTFLEHRAYIPGDDLRHLDWRAFARRGRPHIKLYADEVRGTLEIMLDASASMGYLSQHEREQTLAQPQVTDTLRKWDTARVLAYALAALALQQQDAVGLLAWQQHPTRLLLPQTHAAQLRRVLAQLAKLIPAGDGAHAIGAASSLLQGRPTARRVVVISDFLRDAEQSVQALQQLVRRGHEVCALHIVHPDERSLPFTSNLELVCLEAGTPRLVAGDAQREAFARRGKLFDEGLRRSLVRAGVQYVHHPCEAQLGTALQQIARGAAAAR